VLDQVEFEGEEIALIRNHHQVARILPEPMHQTALEAMSDLHRTLSEDAGKYWVEDSRKASAKRHRLNKLHNPWVT
jgi:hypothetical protein